MVGRGKMVFKRSSEMVPDRALFYLDMEWYITTLYGKDLELTAVEFQLLRILFKKTSRIFILSDDSRDISQIRPREPTESRQAHHSLTQVGPLKTLAPAAFAICLSMDPNIRAWEGAISPQYIRPQTP